MVENVHEALRRWLSVERRATSDDSRAERALRELMRRLPDVGPRAGFAGRVTAAAFPGLHAAGAPPVRAPMQPFGWPLRALASVCLLLTGAALACVPPLVALFAESLTLADAISAMVRLFTTMIDYLTLVIALGKLLGALYEALLLVLTSPPVALVWLGALVFSTLTLRWLAQLLSPSRRTRRSSEYVPARS